MMKRILICLMIVCCSFMNGQACTSAVISGKATADGRPLLWKNRDTGSLQNSVKYFKGTKYHFIGIVNSQAKHPSEVWMGTNEAGFAIMNTQTYNLEKKTKDDDDRGPSNGKILYQALSVCATVSDFKHFLDTIPKPSGIEANIGVIDAQGGAAMFEIGYYLYTFYDANDSKTAPNGYIARTNFSFSGTKDEGGGYVRYQTEDTALLSASSHHSITPEWIFTSLSRSFKNPLLGIDLRNGSFNTPETKGWFVDQDFIPRYLTASSVVVQGVRPHENPELTTMWTLLGYPPVSIAFPLWVKGAGSYLPMCLRTIPDEKTTPLGKKVSALKEKVFSFHQGSNSEKYFNWEVLYNKEGKGIMQQLVPVEEEIFRRSTPLISRWRERKEINVEEMKALYANLSDYITERYHTLFGL
jgi:hypothetical protein